MKLTEYPSTKTLKNDDVLISDGSDGTRIIKLVDLVACVNKLDTVNITGTNFSKNAVAYKRSGVINIVYNGDISSLAANTLVTLFTMPEGYRPIEKTIVSIANNIRTISLVINTNGVVQAINYGSAITAANNFAFSVTYMSATL